MKRALATAGILAVLVIGVAVWWLLGSLDSLVKSVIESTGSDALGVPVHVSRVHVALQEGRASIHGLRIENPPGFSPNPLFSVDSITVALDIASLGRSPIVIRDIAASAPAVRLEVDAAGRVNVQQLQKGMPAAKTAGKAQAPAAPAGSTKPAIRLRIDSLVVAQGRIAGDASALGQGKVDAVLPTLSFARLEGSPPEIAQQITRVLVKRIAGAVARAGVRRGLEKKLGKEGAGAVEGLLDKLSGSRK